MEVKANFINLIFGMDWTLIKRGNIQEKYMFGDIMARGESHYSVVRKAVNIDTGQEVAIKIIYLRDFEADDELNLHCTIEVLMILDHPSIVKLDEVWEDRRTLYLVMDFMFGCKLFDKIVKKSRFSEQEAAKTMLEIVDVVNYCHSVGLIGGNLKLESFLYKSESSSTIMVSDFGLSGFLNDFTSMMFDGYRALNHLAPEKLMATGHSLATDIWSLGVILYTMLCGYPPFYAKDRKQLSDLILKGQFEFKSPEWDNISDEAKELIKKMLVVDPDKRITGQEILSHPWMINHLQKN